jgi:hypothetical protein
MSNVKGVTTLKSIVADILMDDPDMGLYLKYLNYATRILRELNLFHIRIVNTVRLSMSTLGTVGIPDDYMSFVSLSVPVNGQQWIFTSNEKLIIPDTETGGVQELDIVEGEGVVLGNGSDLAGYGVGGGRNDYYYRIDLPNNRIVINGFNRSTVTLTYVGTGIKIGQETIVPVIAKEAMIAGIQMMIDRRDKTVPMNQKDMSKMIYEEECEKLILIQGPTIDELFDAIAETYYQSAKR